MKLLEDSLNRSTISDYEILKVLGKGSFGVVYKAMHIKTGLECAVKQFDKSVLVVSTSQQNPKTESDLASEIQAIQREVDITKAADHPLIVHFYDAFEDEDNLYIIMEYIEGKNLLEYVNEKKRLKEDEANFLFKQLLSTIQYLHNDLNVVHRDIKAENIIIDTHGNLRLIDFGLSRRISAVSETDQDGDMGMRTLCGSPAYVAPEIIKRESYSILVDIWSCGVILYSMVCGRLPFYDKNIPRLLRLVAFEEPTYPSHLSPSLKQLIQQILMKDPNERITIEEIKLSEWFQTTQYGQKGAINMDFLLTDPYKIAEIPLQHNIIYHMNKIGYKVLRSSAKQSQDAGSDQLSLSEEEMAKDITEKVYGLPILTAYKILKSYRIQQNLFNAYNSFNRLDISTDQPVSKAAFRHLSIDLGEFRKTPLANNDLQGDRRVSDNQQDQSPVTNSPPQCAAMPRNSNPKQLFSRSSMPMVKTNANPVPSLNANPVPSLNANPVPSLNAGPVPSMNANPVPSMSPINDEFSTPNASSRPMYNPLAFRQHRVSISSSEYVPNSDELSERIPTLNHNKSEGSDMVIQKEMLNPALYSIGDKRKGSSILFSPNDRSPIQLNPLQPNIIGPKFTRRRKSLAIGVTPKFVTPKFFS